MTLFSSNRPRSVVDQVRACLTQKAIVDQAVGAGGEIGAAKRPVTHNICPF